MSRREGGGLETPTLNDHAISDEPTRHLATTMMTWEATQSVVAQPADMFQASVLADAIGELSMTLHYYRIEDDGSPVVDELAELPITISEEIAIAACFAADNLFSKSKFPESMKISSTVSLRKMRVCSKVNGQIYEISHRGPIYIQGPHYFATLLIHNDQYTIVACGTKSELSAISRLSSDPHLNATITRCLAIIGTANENLQWEYVSTAGEAR